jgi:hypothetical protein
VLNQSKASFYFYFTAQSGTFNGELKNQFLFYCFYCCIIMQSADGTKVYRNVVFDLGGVLLAWDPPAFLAGIFSDRLPQDCPLELAQATSLPCWKLLDRGDISREESIALLPAPFNKGSLCSFHHQINK